MINVIFSIPAATDPGDVAEVFEGHRVIIPDQGVMPASATSGGKHLVHCVIDATYKEIQDITADQRPVWQIFAAKDTHGNVVHKALNNSVWNHMPDRNGRQQTELHDWQGHTNRWPTR